MLDRRVRKRVNVPNNVAQLQLALIQEWNNIPQRTIDNLVGSMVRRVKAATAARGGHALLIRIIQKRRVSVFNAIYCKRRLLYDTKPIAFNRK